MPRASIRSRGWRCARADAHAGRRCRSSTSPSRRCPTTSKPRSNAQPDGSRLVGDFSLRHIRPAWHEIAHMGAQNLRARFFAPPAELAGCFTSFYLLEVDLADGERVGDWLQPEWANLRFFFGALPETRRQDGTLLSGTPFSATGPSSAPV